MTYNPLITGNPLIIFLGAGASKPYGKMLMSEFVKYLEKEKGFGNNPLFQEIISMPDGRDLEHLFEELDEWSRKGYHKGRTTVQPLLGPRKRGLESATVNEFEDLADAASRLQTDLREEVFNAYSNIDDGPKHKAVIRLFEELFPALLVNPRVPTSHFVVFTTNYDPVIETFCQDQSKRGAYKLCDGFASQTGANAEIALWHPDSFHNLDLSADSRTHVVLFKLHGSTNWYRRGNQFVKTELPIYTPNHPNLENLLIYPAKRKVALEEPYFTAYDYFQRTLEGQEERDKLCIVIGYSFRDYDALSRLRSASRQNPNLKLLVIDPRAKDLCSQTLEPLGIRAEPVTTHFGKEVESGPPLTLMDVEDDYLQRIKKAVNALRYQ